MIANFFRSLNQHRVECLLISGQATVLYGAATFSEDIDLSLHPRTAATLGNHALCHFELLIGLVREHGFHLAQEFFWYNPAKLPASAEWVWDSTRWHRPLSSPSKKPSETEAKQAAAQRSEAKYDCPKK